MTKAELVEKFYFAARLPSKAHAESLINIFYGIMENNLVRGDGIVPIPNLGKLMLKTRKGHNGRNPQTGESITIPAKKVVVFKLSKTLAEKLNA